MTNDIPQCITDFANAIRSLISTKANKTNGASEITDSDSDDYTNIATMQSGATQATINDAINIKLGNVVEKSLTNGLLKNDGTVDTNTYLQSGFSSAEANKNVVTDSNGGLTVEAKPTIPSSSNSTPQADSSMSWAGFSDAYARADHVHPLSSEYATSNALLDHNQNSDAHMDIRMSIPTVPSASSTTPRADTTNGSIGLATTWAKADHTHPKSSIYEHQDLTGWTPQLIGNTGATYGYSYSESNGEAVGKGFLLNGGFLNTDNWKLSFLMKIDNIRYCGITFLADTSVGYNGANYDSITDKHFIHAFEGGWPSGTNYATYNDGEIDWFDVTVTKIDSTHVRLQSTTLNRDTNVEASWLPNAKMLSCGGCHNQYGSSFGPVHIKNVVATTSINPYPVGAIYMSVNSTNPSLLFGGTWVQLTDTFLYASTTADADATTAPTGQGEATHTLTSNEMPSHTHTQEEHTHTQNSHSHNAQSGGFLESSGTIASTDKRAMSHTSGNYYYPYSTAKNTYYRHTATGSTTATNQKTTATNKNTGGGQAHNNMPPYMKVYMWKRTA